MLISIMILLCFTTSCSNKAEEKTSEMTSSNDGLSNSSNSVDASTNAHPKTDENNNLDHSILSRINNTLTCEDLITQTYSINDIYHRSGFGYYFSAKAHSGYFETLQSVNDMCKIECIRDIGDNFYYSVFRIQEGGYVFSFFSKENNNLLSHSIYLIEPLDITKFRNLKKGDAFSEVLIIDPAISKCFEKGFLCNEFVIEETTYTVHLFEDRIMLISLKKVGDGDPSAENIVIDTIQEFPNPKLVLDLDDVLENGIYDYSVLSQDYPK